MGWPKSTCYFAAAAAGAAAGGQGLSGGGAAGPEADAATAEASARFGLVKTQLEVAPLDPSPRAEAGPPGELADKALLWARDASWSLSRAAQDAMVAKNQASLARALAQKAAIQVDYLSNLPCLRNDFRARLANAQLTVLPLLPPQLDSCLWQTERERHPSHERRLVDNLSFL
mmetsp:Transcript_8671/g.16425  ORF Transcript_8671/g.16425 Transcript_8671/m.16425 type:complete len:173 (-) Transcript_8671:174-692(-)|eukprot:CAMPEP_0172723888 /NCGR_PEP_ID=MMETSP1074-20121228/84761_1 /TAXON_ID=2916 /ORGANISM="Ceratium fusus, Strain PA161109" /LENGTH=172 /DNA_ID=CAMNT_0013550217 /DNA_START=68 /DNA_END=586 /DNA_ORIENTATION=-